MTKRSSLRLLGVLVAVAAFGLASTAWATTITISNTDPISIPAAGSATGAGKADPYPSSIVVGGILDVVVDLNVTLSSLSHSWTDDIYIVLEGPTGQSLVLWNDAGGGTSVLAVDITFDDEAPGKIPNFGPLGAGSYQVSQYGRIPGAAGTAPAPNPGFGGNLGLFDGLDANGTWNLWAFDDANFDTGVVMNGWSLTFETRPIPEPTAAVLFAVGTFVVGGTLRRQRR